MRLPPWEPQLGTGTAMGLGDSRDTRAAGSEATSLAASKAHKGRVQMAGSEAPALFPPTPRSSGCCQNCGCLSATLLMALGKQGEKSKLLFFWHLLQQLFMPVGCLWSSPALLSSRLCD